MNSKEYVLNHDFGYGRVPETKIINKLNLRNIEDLKIYVDDILENCFLNYEQGSLTIKEKDIQFKIIIEEL